MAPSYAGKEMFGPLAERFSARRDQTACCGLVPLVQFLFDKPLKVIFNIYEYGGDVIYLCIFKSNEIFLFVKLFKIIVCIKF